MKSSILTIIALAAASIASAETAVVLEQKGSPLKITSYEAVFEPESRGRYDSHSDRIKHSLKYSNVSEKKIVALRIGIAAFDAFNNFMGRFGGVSIEELAPKVETDGVWTQSPYAAFLFKKYGTGVVYVSELRFEDGTFWRADMDSVLAQMRKFEATLEKDDLKEKTGK
ncbi:hypothetical protein [Geminisphaera colitermitum]|uniref:hypothetical protein n=1 Tax=Geminisphaera colitermitum TaxID=1148786 RepID=UPI000158CDCD|nr:hypothetical protein [Geminisphaera colitermitum]